jgi:hypothetical protein
VDFFRRRREETLNEQLLRQAGFDADGTQHAPGPVDPRSSDALGLGGLQPQRPRVWDVVVSATIPELEGDRYELATLPDGTLIVDESCNEDLSELGDAVERQLPPPYRALAVRQDGDLWSVAANAITVLELPGAADDELSLALVGGVASYTVDGASADAEEAPQELARAGAAGGLSDYAVSARRLDGALFEVTVKAL